MFRDASQLSAADTTLCKEIYRKLYADEIQNQQQTASRLLDKNKYSAALKILGNIKREVEAVRNKILTIKDHGWKVFFIRRADIICGNEDRRLMPVFDLFLDQLEKITVDTEMQQLKNLNSEIATIIERYSDSKGSYSQRGVTDCETLKRLLVEMEQQKIVCQQHVTKAVDLIHNAQQFEELIVSMPGPKRVILRIMSGHIHQAEASLAKMSESLVKEYGPKSKQVYENVERSSKKMSEMNSMQQSFIRR